MPIASNVSTHALALYDHLLRRDIEGKPAFGIASHIPPGRLTWDDLNNQRAWRELADLGLTIESPDYGRYGAYNYIATEQRTKYK